MALDVSSLVGSADDCEDRGMAAAADADIVAALRELVAEKTRVSVSPSVLDQHGRAVRSHEPPLPDVVVFAVSTREVSAVLRFANEHRIPVVPFGSGSSLEGHVIDRQ